MGYHPGSTAIRASVQGGIGCQEPGVIPYAFNTTRDVICRKSSCDDFRPRICSDVILVKPFNSIAHCPVHNGNYALVARDIYIHDRFPFITAAGDNPFNRKARVEQGGRVDIRETQSETICAVHIAKVIPIVRIGIEGK